MISWIQTIIEKKGRWIFVVLLAIIIVAFVFTIGNTPGFVGSANKVEFYGHVLARGSKDVRELSNKAIMSSYLQYGSAPFSDQFLQVEVYRRAAYLHLADELSIPSPTKKEVQDYIRSLRSMQGNDGKFSATEFTRIIDKIETDTQLDGREVEIVLAEDYRMQKVLQLLGDDSYVLEKEAEWDAIRGNTEYSLEIVEYPKEAFEPEIEVNNEALKSFYESNKADFRVPEKIKLSYILIPDTKFVFNEDSLTKEQLQAFFVRNSFRYVDNNSEVKAENYDALEEDKKAQMIKDLISEMQREKSAEFANEFVLNMFQSELEQGSEAYNAYLAKNEVTEVEISPYPANQPPAHPLIPQLQLRNAFSLSDSKYFSDVFRVSEGQALLIYQGKEQPFIPDFETVKSQVEVSFKDAEKESLFVKKGNELSKSIVELAAKEDNELSLDSFLEKSGLVRKKIESFKLASPSSEVPSGITLQLSEFDIGSYSDFIVEANSGYFVKVLSKTAPEGEDLEKAVEDRREQLENTYSYLLSQALFGELIDRGMSAQ